MEIFLSAYKDTLKPKAFFFEMLGCTIWFFLYLIITERCGVTPRYWFIGFVVWIILVRAILFNPRSMLRKIQKAVKENPAVEFEEHIRQEMASDDVVRYTDSHLYLWITRTWFIFLSNYGSIILKRTSIRAIYSRLTTHSKDSLVIEYGADSIFSAACGIDSDEIVQLVDYTNKGRRM